MSKSGSSAHWGGARPSGGRATRCRSGGKASIARSRPARRRSGGAGGSTVSPRTVVCGSTPVFLMPSTSVGIVVVVGLGAAVVVVVPAGAVVVVVGFTAVTPPVVVVVVVP